MPEVVGLAVAPALKASAAFSDDMPETNLSDALAVPRNSSSMPGKYPGKVTKVNHSGSVVNGKPFEEAALEDVAYADVWYISDRHTKDIKTLVYLKQRKA